MFSAILPSMSYKIAITGLLLAIVSTLLVLVHPLPLYAHGSGLTLTATTTDYLVDVDYNTFTIVAEDGGFLGFLLFSDAERTKPVEFTSVWARIASKVETSDHIRYDTIFSGQIARSLFGSTGLSITLPQSGEYMLTLRFYNGEDELVDTSIPFTVEPPYDEQQFNYSMEFWTGLGGGSMFVLLLALLYSFRKRISSLVRR